MANPWFRITDGTTVIDLLQTQGFLLRSWNPVALQKKGGGVVSDSALAHGSAPVLTKEQNMTEEVSFVARHESEDGVYEQIQDLLRLLEHAVEYWTSSWSTPPVWIEARGPNETNMRYGVIVNYNFQGIGGPFEQPLFYLLNIFPGSTAFRVRTSVSRRVGRRRGRSMGMLFSNRAKA
jgi:hypothetical protein